MTISWESQNDSDSLCYIQIHVMIRRVIKGLHCIGQITVTVSLCTLLPNETSWSGSKVIKLFLCSTQLSMKFIMLVNVKMPTIVIVGIFIPAFP